MTPNIIAFCKYSARQSRPTCQRLFDVLVLIVLLIVSAAAVINERVCLPVAHRIAVRHATNLSTLISNMMHQKRFPMHMI